MSLGFGFSVGDIIAVLKLVGTVTDALRESSNATNTFRGLINELYALETALLAVKRLDADIKHIQKVALEQAAIQCQMTIDQFYEKIRKSQPHLQGRGADSRLKDAWEKIKWATCKKSDVELFRAQIRGHISSIEILLLTIQMEAASTQADAQNTQLKSLGVRMQDFSFQVMGKLGAITSSVTQSVQQGKALLESSAKVVQTNLRIFQVVHDIQLFILKIPGQIQRQRPVYLVNPLNRETPFFLEFVRSPEALLAVLKLNLRDTGCGPRMIDQGEFVIQESGTGDILDLSASWDSCFYPGQRVAMSMVFKQQGTDNSASCPRCGQIQDKVATKEITCQSCGTVFRRVEEINETPNHIEHQNNEITTEMFQEWLQPETKFQPMTGPARPSNRMDEATDSFSDLRKFRRLWISCNNSKSTLHEAWTSPPLWSWASGVLLLEESNGVLEVSPSQIRHPMYECAFWFLNCAYISDYREEWETHCLSHFRGEDPPKSFQCPLCDFHCTYDDGYTAWNARMEHVAAHHFGGATLKGSGPDFLLFQHLWQKRLIDDLDLKELKGGNHNLSTQPSNYVLARRRRTQHISGRRGAGDRLW